MNAGLYRSISALDVGEKRLESVTTNLANVSTPGFKRHQAAHHGFQVQGPGGMEYGVRTSERIDFSQGNLDRTNNPLDLALMGQGFFEVEGQNGPQFTRNGRMSMDDQGVLLAGGLPVAWDGARGTLSPQGSSPVIATDGSVSQDGNTVGRLKLVDFEARESLTLSRDGMFLAAPNLVQRPAVAEVHQGAVEQSNSSGIDELVQLITIQRNHESASRVLGMIDQTYQRLHQRR